LSLKSANEQISTFSEKNPEIRIAHIMLTDGQSTMGKSLPEDLKSLVDPYYRNIFVGYGEDHDGHLMSSLGELSANCEYKFVDIIENTGLVYGEILYNLLYPLFQSPVYLQVSNGAKIYDWHQNTWVSNLVIPPLSGNSEKIFQIVADGTVTTDNIYIDMFANDGTCTQETKFHCGSPVNVDGKFNLVETAIPLPRLICAETERFEPNDLTQYLLRQLTQEYLYMAREFENERVNQNRPFSQKPMLRRQTAYVDMDDPQPPEVEVIHRQLKNSLLEHLHELSVYHEAYETLPEEQFIKVLMDDMHVAIQNMGTQRGLMYTAARQTSQGRQSSYIPSSTLDKDTMKTVDLYRDTSNRSINVNTPRDVMSMMTQVQGFEMDMYMSDTESMIESETESPCTQVDSPQCKDDDEIEELSGTGILGHDIGYDQHDVFNAEYYYDNHHKTFNLVRSATVPCSHRTGTEGPLIQLTTESTFGAQSSLEELDDKDACETNFRDVGDVTFQNLNDLNNHLCYVRK
jgi:hypothetical protein